MVVEKKGKKRHVLMNIQTRLNWQELKQETLIDCNTWKMDDLAINRDAGFIVDVKYNFRYKS